MRLPLLFGLPKFVRSNLKNTVIDLLLKKDYHNRPTIDEVINNINLISENYIIAEINISEKRYK